MKELVDDLNAVLMAGTGMSGFHELCKESGIPHQLYWHTVYCFLGFHLLAVDTIHKGGEPINYLAVDILKELSRRVAIIVGVINNRGSAS